MKKLLLLWSLLVLSNTIQAVTPPPVHTIVYDFKTKKLGLLSAAGPIADLPTLKPSDKFVVKVLNVNRYLYQVGISVNNEEFVAKPPALLAGLFNPSGELAAAIANLTAGGGAAGGAGAAGAAPLTPITKVVGKFLILINLEKDISVAELIAYDSHSLRTAALPSPTFASISDELKANLQKCYDFEDAYYAALKAASTDVLIKSLQEVKQVYDKHNFVDRFTEYSKFQLNLTQENFEFVTRELEADIDVMHVAITIVPRDPKETTFYIPLETDSLKFDVQVKQKQGRLSFSQGLFVSGLVNDEYAYKATVEPGVDTVTSYKIVSEDKRGAGVGIVAMAHYTWGNDKSRGGFHLGIGIPIEKQLNGQIFAGGTYAVSIGRQNKLFFNLGPVVGLVRTISSTYLPNEKFKTTGRSIPYTQSLSYSWAFSITFNFF